MSNLELHVRIAAGVMVVFLSLCALSRTTMAESALGGYARGQLLQVLQGVVRESDIQGQVSRQDSDPLIALLHNTEAIANLRIAKRLAEETGLTKDMQVDFMDVLAELSNEQEILVRTLSDSEFSSEFV